MRINQEPGPDDPMRIAHLGGPYHCSIRAVSRQLPSSYVAVTKGAGVREIRTLYKLQTMATRADDGSHHNHPLLSHDGIQRAIIRSVSGDFVVEGWKWPIYVADNAHLDPKNQHLIRGEQP